MKNLQKIVGAAAVAGFVALAVGLSMKNQTVSYVSGGAWIAGSGVYMLMPEKKNYGRNY